MSEDNSQLSAPPAAADSPDPDPGVTRAGSRFPLIGIVVAAVVLLLGGVYLVDWLTSKDELQRGVSIGGVEVGGKTPAEATAALESTLAGLSAPLTLQAHDAPVTLNPATAGLALDVEGSVAAAGTRSANPFSRIGALFGSKSTSPVLTTVDSAALTAELTAVAASTDLAPVEGGLTISGVTPVVVDPIVGAQLDVPGSVAAVAAAWTSGDPASVNGLVLPVTTSPVRVSAAALATAAAEVSALIGEPLTVQAGDLAIEVPVETLAAAVTIAPDAADGFVVSADEATVKAAFAAAVEATQSQPADASVKIENGAPVLTPGVDGRLVDWPATDLALTAALRAPDHVLTVSYALTPPAVTTESVQALGIAEVVSEFTTGGFARDSGQNIKRAAEKVNGAIVQPGAVFSLNGYTGQRGVAAGYIEAGIINNGVADRGVGGGISQFATTLFNASYFAGFEDIEHKAHSYYISRYPPGREATVFEADDGSSLIDVKFRNTSSTAVLIETVWTPDDITVRMWGTKSVNVESIPGARYNITPPPTRTIPYGETCKATNGSNGFSIDVTRVVTDLAGAELSRTTATTVYNGQVKVSCTPAPTPAPDPAPGG